MLSAYFYGFCISIFGCGFIADRFGAKILLQIAPIGTALCTIVIPELAKLGPEYIGFCRLVLGVLQASFECSRGSWLVAWFPLSECSRVTMTVVGSGLMGCFCALYPSGLLCEHFGWRTAFYVPSSLLLVTGIVWAFVCAERPQADPNLSSEELAYLEANISKTRGGSIKRSPPILKMITCGPVVALAAGYLIDNLYMTLTTVYMPEYLSTVLGFNVAEVRIEEDD